MTTQEYQRTIPAPDADLSVYTHPIRKHVTVQVQDRHYGTVAMASLTREQAEELRAALSAALYRTATTISQEAAA